MTNYQLPITKKPSLQVEGAECGVGQTLPQQNTCGGDIGLGNPMNQEDKTLKFGIRR